MDFELIPQADKYVSIRECAEILGINYSTARRWLADGRLPGDTFGGKVVARKSEIERLARTLEGTLSIAEVSKMINRAERTVNHLITTTKELDAIMFMRRWYVIEKSVEKYLESRDG